MTASDQQVFVRAADVLWRAIPDGVLVLQRHGGPVSVTGPGRALWDALGRARTRDELATTLCDAFGVERASAYPVVETVLPELIRLGVVQAIRRAVPA